MGSYKKALDDARLEMAEALRLRAELDSRIARLRQTISSLAQLCDERIDLVDVLLREDMGLTEACQEVLRAAFKPLTGLEVKAGLEKMGFDLSRYSNPLASIYPTLNRLA